ncbi:MAG: thioesterase domain-containing protein, partial [Candidatus Bathyarchaeota archaeon]|nr:thioesterase domain-containing protein [Candidatus Bathyarchaeota archaeon]
KIPERVIEEYSSRYLKEILKKQAEGPYILAGAGPGALIALEMARRLKDTEVKVILIEALHTKSIFSGVQDWRVDRLLEEIRSIPNQVLVGVRGRNLMKFLTIKIELLLKTFVESSSIAARMNRAVKRYDPVQYLSPVLLFMAQTRIGYSPDPSVRIKELLLFLKGDVETHVIQGEHMGILKEPGARKIAEIINNYIKK